MTDRVFLDANVLFSAAWREDSGLLRLWRRPETELLTSAYALEEARRNLEHAPARQRLKALASTITIVPEALGRDMPEDLQLPEKDRPILLAALAARATHLVTGDRRDFGSLYGLTIRGTLVLPPARYLADGPT